MGHGKRAYAARHGMRLLSMDGMDKRNDRECCSCALRPAAQEMGHGGGISTLRLLYHDFGWEKGMDCEHSRRKKRFLAWGAVKKAGRRLKEVGSGI